MTERQQRIIRGLQALYTRTYGAYDTLASQIAETYRIGETDERDPRILEKAALEQRLAGLAFRLSLVERPSIANVMIVSVGDWRIVIRYTEDTDGTVFCKSMIPLQLACFQAYISQLRTEERPSHGASLSVISDTASALWDSFLETLSIPDEDTEENY